MADYSFKLPDVGEGMHEGEIVKWLVKPGDAIEEDQVVVEVQNDKSVVELPTSVSGKVKEIKAAEGTTATVGDVLAIFEVEGEAGEDGAAAGRDAETGREAEAGASGDRPAARTAALDAGMGAAAEPGKVGSAQAGAPGAGVDTTAGAQGLGAAAPAGVNEGGRAASAGAAPGESGAPAAAVPAQVLATPSVRKLAREKGVELAQVPATGRHGQVTREDVEAYLSGGRAAAHAEGRTESAASQGAAADATPAPAVGNGGAPNQPAGSSAQEERVPLRGVRKLIAQAMVKSVYTAPHVTVMDEADVSKLVEFRERYKPLAEKRGVKLTYLPFIVKALVAAVKEYPILNASVDDERNEIVYKHAYHVGIATDTDNGLIVPVVAEADRKSIWKIAAEIKDLAARGREGKLAANEMRGSTISITNIGSAGGMFFTPVINYPEVAILGTGRISEKPVVRNGELAVGRLMALSLSFDHRVIDGATAQHAVNYIKQLLEEPELLILEV